jgi:metallo-beta-lactamase class B
MLKIFRRAFVIVLALYLMPATLGTLGAAAQQPAGHVWTQQEVFRRNVGSREEQTTAFTPHKVVANIYYVGTQSLASFLVTTPQGHILINSSYEGNVPVLKSSVERLGFKWTDVKILLGSHAHGDHMEGDAAVKEQTGATVVSMAEDVPALEKIRPGGKLHPIDRVIHDGDTVALGGTTLVAHLTPGHTRGCTTWTMKVQDGGRMLDVVIIGSAGVNPGFVLVNNKDTPQIADEFRRTFQILRSLPCDIPLASHPAMYSLAEKFPKLGKGPNPFIDPAGYRAEIDIAQGVFNQVWAEQGGK